MSHQMSSPYLDTRQAATYLRLRPSTLDRWRSVGGGPPFHKLGGRVIYSRDDLDAFVAAGRRVSTSDDCYGSPQTN